MFSRRTAWDRSTNRLADLVDRARREGLEVLDLTESNPTRVGIPYPAGEILASLADPATLVYEPDPLGHPGARHGVAQVYAGRGVSVRPEDILLTASSSEAYAWLFKLLLDPGDQVLVPTPSYPLFEYLTALEGAQLTGYPLHFEEAWQLAPEAVEERITERTRAVVVVSPNNPTGGYLKRQELESLASLCSRNGLALIGDEVFAEYPHGDDPARAGSVLEAPQTLSFSLGGLSKLAGLPQMKLGWIAMGGPEQLKEEARQRLELVADTYLSAGTPVQLAAPALLRAGAQIRREIRRRIGTNLDTLKEMVTQESGCRLLPCEGGWSAILRVPAILSEEEWVLALFEEDRVLAHPGYFFDFPTPAYLVLSLLPREADFRRGVGRILARSTGEGAPQRV